MALWMLEHEVCFLQAVPMCARACVYVPVCVCVRVCVREGVHVPFNLPKKSNSDIANKEF